jgi:hypothetical protein
MTKMACPLLSVLVLVSACGSSPDDGGQPNPSGQGPVATNASEAWPTAPENVPGISSSDILRACSIAGSCSSEVSSYDTETRTGLVDLCVYDTVFSAERAVPISGFTQANERAEFWTRCVLDNADSCDAVEACKTKRDTAIYCQEDGCRATEKLAVSCAGDVATLDTGSRSFSRDCARAYAKCDTQSPTGCTDRHYSQCAPEAAGAGAGDRCDGSVRLGCDGGSQVSYRDCTRLGGSCGAIPGDGQSCVYTAAEGPACDPELSSAECNGGTLSACVNGFRLSQTSPLCAK